ncbi:serine hydrolase domain-containing protein [Amycolatopsis jejuensis]|uniref:serine hydrolase domain-containing protein n=1 Tax=Amycolatopsis jejuensis TaxID=330084 RepID=UPI000524185A|nr:serine hydrolase domain-containing protein [Amycolatopsis jejuensis]
MSTSKTTEVRGYVEEGWGSVADAFRENFELHGDVGAACSVYAKGNPVVDLWGGVADPSTGRPWQEDTVVLAMSTTKGATAICANRLAERGEIDLDAPVAEYWPEFAANGKEATKVRWLLSHQAGLPVLDGPLTLEQACEWTPVVEALAAQPPLWEPGTRHAYHAFTYGFLIGEVVRRATGRTIGQTFAEEVAVPLRLDAWIGLPHAAEARVAPLQPPPEIEMDPATAEMMAQLTGPESVFGRAMAFGGAVPPTFVTERGGMNARQVRASEWPAANMVSDARSVARMYAATIGDVAGVRLLSEAALERAVTRQTADSTIFGAPPGMEASLDMQFGLGFMLPAATQWLSPASFGHSGAGGSLGFADRDAGIGFGYVMNQMAMMPDDPRTRGLIAAVRGVLG